MNQNKINNLKICVVIPYYNASEKIHVVISKIPEFIDKIVVVNDCSKEPVPDSINQFEKVLLLETNKNSGVGGATKVGFKKVLELDFDIIIKMDADDQMDAKYLPELISAISKKKYGYAKGNRFKDLNAISKMPYVRRIGNIGLSFLTKMATGYWNNFDPTNGYFAIKKDVLKRLNLSKIENRYFFETSMLSQLYLLNVSIKDIIMPAIYNDEKSNMKVWKIPFEFIPKLSKVFIKRVLNSYFVFDFNIGSFYIFFGVLFFVFGLVFGLIKWYHYTSNNTLAPTGTIIIATLTIIIGFQLILQAIQYDISKAPKS